ncbi:uncharacterized protein [Panulirus ornatus]
MGDRMLVLSWKYHSLTFSNVISKLRDKENYTDVTVACEGKFYYAHKLVLAACSEYFEDMFQHTSCKHPIVVLKDVASKELEALLSYMYAGVASVAQNDLASLIRAAEALRIKGLAVPDDNETQDCGSSSNNETNPKPKRRRKEESTVPTAPVSETASNSCENQEECSQSGTQSEQARYYVGSEQLDEASEEDAPQRLNLSGDISEEQILEPQTSQLADNSELECTPDMPFKEIFDETLVKEELPENCDDKHDLSFHSEIDYHPLSDSMRLSGESKEVLEDHTTESFLCKFEASAMNHHGNLPQDTTGQVGSHHPDTDAQHNPGPSRVQENAGGSSSYDGFQGLEAYNCENQPELYSQLTSQLNLPSQPPHPPVRLSNGNGLGRRGRAGGPWANLSPTRKMHRCVHCNYSTPWHSVFIRHCRRHSGEKPFSCSFCPFRSSRKSVVIRHCMSKHT